MGSQLLLGVLADDPATLDNYFAGPNAEVVAALRVIAGDSPAAAVTWITGAVGTGKSHLLRAVCRHAAGSGRSARYLDNEAADSAYFHTLVGLSELVCVDDAGHLAGNDAAERALLNVLLDAAARGARVVLASRASPAGSGFRMPALATRLASGPVYRLASLRDAEKMRALQLRARCRGMELPAPVARYMMRRSPRDMTTLFALLDRLDAESLAEGRRLTIPFVREFIEP